MLIMMCLDDPIRHGWKEDGTVTWCELYFPDDVSMFKVLLDDDGENDEFYDSENETDDDN